MKSELTEPERTFLTDKELESKFAGSSTIQAFEWEERHRLRAKEFAAIHDTILC